MGNRELHITVPPNRRLRRRTLTDYNRSYIQNKHEQVLVVFFFFFTAGCKLWSLLATGDCGIYKVKTQLDYTPARIEMTCWWPRQCCCCQPLEMGPCAREVSLHSCSIWTLLQKWPLLAVLEAEYLGTWTILLFDVVQLFFFLIICMYETLMETS